MRLKSRRVSLLCCLVAAACAQNSGSTSLPARVDDRVFSRAATPLAAGGFKSIYPFGKNAYDGSQPMFLAPYRSKLYGTASSGGSSGEGIIFSVTVQGAEQILHTFTGTDGAAPVGPLYNVRGLFYGTASSGGSGPGASGVVFTLDTDGSFGVVHTFRGGSKDGAQPWGGLVGLNGKLWGTTAAGGANNLGTVYSITLNGAVHVIHSFNGSDGEQPLSTLKVVDGDLYGTTLVGGKFGGGTIFRVTTGGNLKVLHSFGKGKDGVAPYYGALIAVDGSLYGTTFRGGAKGVGTVFKSSLKGTEKVLFSFAGTPAKGCEPYAGLIVSNGSLYGTTAGGTGAPCVGGGTVYRVGDNAKTIHQFSGGSGGNAPVGLVLMDGVLYGVTAGGGPYSQGTFFSVTPR